MLIGIYRLSNAQHLDEGVMNKRDQEKALQEFSRKGITCKFFIVVFCPSSHPFSILFIHLYSCVLLPVITNSPRAIAGLGWKMVLG